MGGGLFFFFTVSFSKWICQTTITLPEMKNVVRHFRIVHKKYDADFPSKKRAEKEKGEGAKITGNRTTVVFHTAEFTKTPKHLYG